MSTWSLCQRVSATQRLILLTSDRARATKDEGEDNSSGVIKINADKQKELVS